MHPAQCVTLLYVTVMIFIYICRPTFLRRCDSLIAHGCNTNSTVVIYSVKQQICFAVKYFVTNHPAITSVIEHFYFIWALLFYLSTFVLFEHFYFIWALLFYLSMTVANKYCWSHNHIICRVFFPQILFVCRLILWIQLMLNWWGVFALFLVPWTREMMSPSWCPLMVETMCTHSLPNR